MWNTDVSVSCAAYVKENTRESHEAAERVMMPLIQNADTPQRYTLLLQKLYGFYHPLEQLIKPFAGSMALPHDFEKSHLLQQDLERLGSEVPATVCTRMPHFKNNFEALGALNVLEGAALGGRIIARMLSKYESLPPDAFSFFEGRGKETGPHWTGFVNFMNGHAKNGAQIEKVCAAAMETFDLHAAWMITP